MTANRKALQEERRKFLVDVGGHPYNTAAPPEAHGRPVGYMSWSCRCIPCRMWNSQRVRPMTDHEQTINLSVSMTLQQFEVLRTRARELDMTIGEAMVHCTYNFPPQVGLTEQQAPAEPDLEGTWGLEPEEFAKAIAEPIEPEPPVVEPEPPVVEPEPPLVEPEPPLVEPPVVEPPVVEPPLSPPDEIPPIPPMIPAIRDMVKGIADVTALSNAYFRPDWTAATGEMDRVRHSWQEHEIIVGGDGNIIYWRQGREVASGESELLTTKQKALPKAKGGGSGSKLYTTTEALIKALKAAGCDVSVGGKHWIIKRDGKTMTLPRTPSDYRSLKNSTMQAVRAGMLTLEGVKS